MPRTTGLLMAVLAFACGGELKNDERGTVFGDVTLVEGDCMPVTTPERCRVSKVSRRVIAFEPQRIEEQSSGGYEWPEPPPSAERGSVFSSAVDGSYELTLPVGRYSLYLEEPAGSFYARSYTSDGNWIELVEVRAGESVERDLEIDYATE